MRMINLPERCLIIGLGNIGLKYDLNLSDDQILTHSKAFFRHPNFELIGAVDKNQDNRNSFEKKYNKPAYKNVKEGVLKTSPSIVVISTPTSTHSIILDEVLEYISPKLILCEKPLDYDLSKARFMIDKFKKKKIELLVNYIRRSDPGSIEIKNRILSGKIKQPLKGFVFYSKGIMNNGSHYLNTLEDWLGKCTSVNCISKKSQYTKNDFNYDFNAYFGKNKISFISTESNTTESDFIKIESSSGQLFYEHGGRSIYWKNKEKNKIREDSKKNEIIQINMDQYQYNVVKEINNSLKNLHSNLSKCDDAYETMRNIKNIISEI